ncbi:MAG: threonine synthase [Spirochaetota bacterium]
MRAIRFSSTRAMPDGKDSGSVDIETAIVKGMPPDGGLFVPTYLPPLSPRVFDLEPLGYADLAFEVLKPFFHAWDEAVLRRILESAYGSAGAESKFNHPEIAPLEHLSDLADPMDTGMEFHLLELYHGRTCAFKDMALSVLGGLLRESLDRLGMKEPVLVLAATSGDTGSAALEGLSGVRGVKTAVLYPQGGTSDIQRLQMTTVQSEGTFVAGIRGDFDDAQRCVKEIFQRASRGEGPLASVYLSSANSINIGRLLPQIVYYVAAWRSLKARNALGADGLMHVAVPTGNFGDILAAKYAKEMGLPIGTMVCASNANKVLADFFATGVYDRRRSLVKTDSPSMDILVSSNLERLLHMAARGDGARVASMMKDLAEQGWFEINETEQAYLSDFSGGWCSDFAAGSTISTVWETSGVLVDPHTATAVEVALRAADRLEPKAPIVVAGTASPYKFPKACLEELDPAAAARPGVSDLEHAARLATLVGEKIPEPIARLSTAQVRHEDVLDIGEVESAIARFASGNGRTY